MNPGPAKTYPSAAVKIRLLQDAVYSEETELWTTLLRYQQHIENYFHEIGLELVVHVPAQVSQISRGSDQGRVIEKMKLKEEHPLAMWVEGELRNQFNHRCCENLEEFERLTGFAITRQGLIRSGGTRHVKDDGIDIRDARYHILGWSNLDKIRRLEESLGELQTNAQAQALLVTQAQARQ
jgi:uncharacterized protein YPO0396